jgi:autotransporter-associated beta strand protein
LVQGGTLDLGGFKQTVSVGTLTGGFVSNGTLFATSGFEAKAGRVDAVLAGTTTLTKSGDGTLTLLGANLYSGTTTVSGGTLQLAAGMNMHVFTTGRGTPYGLEAVPVIKVATRSDLARRWHDLIDLNAGTIATGEATIEEVGWELFRLILEIASGRKSWAEHWKLHNSLALFNPAPVT